MILSEAIPKAAPQHDKPAALSPRQHGTLAAELKALQNEKREAVELLRRIAEATTLPGPLGTTAYIISDATMQKVQDILARAEIQS